MPCRRNWLSRDQDQEADGAGRSPHGDAHFSRSALYQMLRNRICLGEIRHRGTAYPGDHDAIVDADFFMKVGALLENNRNDHTAGIQAEHPSLLCGLVWDGEGRRRMVPSYSNKKGARYRYYVSQQDKDRLKFQVSRVPAGDLESVIIAQLGDHLGIEPNCSGPRDQLRTYVEKVVVEKDRILLIIADRGGSKQVEVPVTWIRRGNQRKLLPSAG
ncbi:MAG TPA: zinc ribbon domain-containing protein [Sphingobium sp.]